MKQWQGPVEPAYGLHLVYLQERTTPSAPALAEIRDRLRTELLSERRREANEAMFRAMRERYDVRVEHAGRTKVADLATRRQ